MRQVPSAIFASLRSWDFGIGLAFGLGVGLLARCDAVRHQGVTGLLAEAAIGVTIMSVVLAALAVLTPSIDGFYRRVLEEAGGVTEALRPYLAVASVSGLAALVALFAAVAWPSLGTLSQSVALGTASTFTAASIVGAISLVEITIFHARARADLQALGEAAIRAPQRVSESNQSEIDPDEQPRT